ncbi:hypothetical protein GF325_00320, partial [Candidatus Bathyarchaeota archaeon]|nr:hypothetical protein [Candidatus Bathyarchaeota archaeon]
MTSMERVKNQDIILCLVAHTHWDREWYLAFEEYRFQLVSLIDKLVNILERDHRFNNFMLDGQTIVLEDYLEVKPSMEIKMRKLVASKKISVGPFYILPDEFLQGPEAHVRNLLLGDKIAGKFGHCMKVGYLPDPFGHIAQLPQILDGFNIDTVVFMRGMGEQIDYLDGEFKWLASDGKTSVLAINLYL